MDECIMLLLDAGAVAQHKIQQRNRQPWSLQHHITFPPLTHPFIFTTLLAANRDCKLPSEVWEEHVFPNLCWGDFMKKYALHIILFPRKNVWNIYAVE